MIVRPPACVDADNAAHLTQDNQSVSSKCDLVFGLTGCSFYPSVFFSPQASQPRKGPDARGLAVGDRALPPRQEAS